MNGTPTPNDLVLVTGAAGGIGLQALRELSAAGFGVIAGVLDEAEAEQVRRASLPNVSPKIVDVSRSESIDAAFADLSRSLPGSQRLVGLVNNAGVNWNAPLQYLTVAEIQRTVSVNLLGPMLMTRAALPLLRKGPARVVFVGSAMGLLATPTVSVYAATKFGIEGLCDGLRVEFAQIGIEVVLIEPGVVRTPMTSGAPGVLEKMLQRMSPDDEGRYGKLMRKIVDMSVGPKAGVEPVEVARIIRTALTVTQPKTRYQVGSDSKAVSWIRHLPDSARDALQRKMFGI